MPVQLVEVEVLAELLESLPPIANDNEDDGGVNASLHPARPHG